LTNDGVTTSDGGTNMGRDILKQSATLSPVAIPDGFVPAQVLAMGSLLRGDSITTAARAAGVSRSTVHRWLSDDPVFATFYNQARREMAEAVEQSLRMLSGAAVTTLRRLMTRRSVSDAVKLQAALAVLKLTQKPVEGPMEVEDATNALLNQKKQQSRDSMLARLGMTKEDVFQYLKRPIDPTAVDDPIENRTPVVLRDYEDDDLDEDAMEDEDDEDFDA
jgi:hypothetical protein